MSSCLVTLSPILGADFMEAATLSGEVRVERQFSQYYRWVAYIMSSAFPSKYNGVLNTERNPQTPSPFSSLSSHCATINRVMFPHLLTSMLNLHVDAGSSISSSLEFTTKHIPSPA